MYSKKESRVVSESMCVPASRMLYLRVAYEPEDSVLKQYHWTRKVLALHTQISDTYRIGVPDSARSWPSLPPVHSDAIRQGFQYMGQECNYGAIIEEPDYGVISTLDFRIADSYDCYSKLIVMPDLENQKQDNAIIDKLLPQMFEDCRTRYELHKEREKKLAKS